MHQLTRTAAVLMAASIQSLPGRGSEAPDTNGKQGEQNQSGSWQPVGSPYKDTQSVPRREDTLAPTFPDACKVVCKASDPRIGDVNVASGQPLGAAIELAYQETSLMQAASRMEISGVRAAVAVAALAYEPQLGSIPDCELKLFFVYCEPNSSIGLS